MQMKTNSKPLLALGLATLLLAAGGLSACGDENSGLTLRALEMSTIEVPVGTKWEVVLELSAIPGTDVFVDIENSYKEFIEFPSDSVRFQPKDDPPKKKIELTGLKESAGHLAVVFSLRGLNSTRTLLVAIVKP